MADDQGFRMIRRFSSRPAHLLLAPMLVLFAGALLPGEEAGAQDKTRGTGLPLPRFVSLKSDEVNVRRGPGQEYEVAFTFVREGLPVEITQEFDNWRKIRDSEGAEGWVFHSLLAGKRTALVAPWDKGGPFPTYVSADAKAPIAAYLEPKVIADVEACTGTWCEIHVKGYEGWIEQERLWGVYPNEVFSE
jgi:SH3-like domain-containing protein